MHHYALSILNLWYRCNWVPLALVSLVSASALSGMVTLHKASDQEFHMLRQVKYSGISENTSPKADQEKDRKTHRVDGHVECTFHLPCCKYRHGVYHSLPCPWGREKSEGLICSCILCWQKKWIHQRPLARHDSVKPMCNAWPKMTKAVADPNAKKCKERLGPLRAGFYKKTTIKVFKLT